MADRAAKLPYRPCVGVMLLNRDGLVWVGRRRDLPADAEGDGHWWQMPQGGIDEGEDAETAARRELHEETGIRSIQMVEALEEWVRYDLPEHLIGVAWKGRYRGQTQKWFAYRFTGKDSEINVLAPPGGHKPEFDDWRWVEMSELPHLIVPFKRGVYMQVCGAFSHLAGQR